MLTLLFLSCKRMEYLRRTLAAIRVHFDTVEPGIRPCYVCFDNGSAKADLQDLERMGFDILFHARENQGIGPAMNRLVSAVRTPYFLNLQDDWVLENPTRTPFAHECIRLLEAQQQLAHIKLDQCHFLDFNATETYTGRLQVAGSPIQFFAQNPRMLWGGYTFPPGITKTAAIHALGPFREDHPFRRGWAESEYSGRFSTQFLAAKSPELLLFKHIGETPTTGWNDVTGNAAQVAPASAHIDAQVPTVHVPSGQAAPHTEPAKSRPQSSLKRSPSAGLGQISCLVTAFKRPHALSAQLQAIAGQTVKPKNVALWHNFHPEHPLEEGLLHSVSHIRSTNTNWGVWPRFLFCLEFETEYVCVFDDDTIPGPRWLENCLETMRAHEGLLGTIGVVFPNGTRGQQSKVGWINPLNKVVETDIVGHAWFFKRDWLRYYALEPRRGFPTCGEDYHFSVALQKHLGIKTYVPPHDPADRSGWGSIQGDLGNDRAALYLQAGEDEKKTHTHNAYLDAGWKPLALRENHTEPIAMRSGQQPKHIQNPNLPHLGNTRNIQFKHDFRLDFEAFQFEGQPFAFTRYGDGEIALCTGRAIRASDGWQYDGSDTLYAQKLREAVRADLPGYYLGISCPCCDPQGHAWYLRNIRAPHERLTFANIFVNANYRRFQRKDLTKAVLVSSSGGDFHVPVNVLQPEFDYTALLEKLHRVDRPILVAAGPLSCILIYEYWRTAPNRQVIWDIGSALDPIIHGRPTRGYHHSNSSTATKTCVWQTP